VIIPTAARPTLSGFARSLSLWTGSSSEWTTPSSVEPLPHGTLEFRWNQLARERVTS
jgi:hypothetical protein